MAGGFVAGEYLWRAGAGTLRQVVRQQLVARQLAEHLGSGPPRRVLDLGCGQGTQALILARGGHRVTALDSSETLLADLADTLAREEPDVRERLRVVRGDALDATELLGTAGFDVVLCHGVLMYFEDPGPLLDTIAALVAPGGLVSLLVRNGDALAMRPGLFADWQATAAAFESTSYRNRIGVESRADRLADLLGRLIERQLLTRAWYGVRVFTDTAKDDAPLPAAEEFAALLDCEERAGRTDPYRCVAALLHVVAQRPSATTL